MDMIGQLFETDLFCPRQAPKRKGTFVHFEPVAINLPGPQGNTSGLDCKSEVLLPPCWRYRLLRDQLLNSCCGDEGTLRAT
jgi:hypothetical protein